MRLKIKRIDRGYTLEKMAVELGVNILTYRAWEMDPRKITIENAHKICKLLKCKFEEIDEWQK